MLGINAPKPLVKGEFAKAVRKAVRDSMVAKENWKEPAAKGPWKVKFIVRQFIDSAVLVPSYSYKCIDIWWTPTNFTEFTDSESITDIWFY